MQPVAKIEQNCQTITGVFNQEPINFTEYGYDSIPECLTIENSVFNRITAEIIELKSPNGILNFNNNMLSSISNGEAVSFNGKEFHANYNCVDQKVGFISSIFFNSEASDSHEFTMNTIFGLQSGPKHAVSFKNGKMILNRINMTNIIKCTDSIVFLSNPTELTFTEITQTSLDSDIFNRIDNNGRKDSIPHVIDGFNAKSNSNDRRSFIQISSGYWVITRAYIEFKDTSEMETIDSKSIIWFVDCYFPQSFISNSNVTRENCFTIYTKTQMFTHLVKDACQTNFVDITPAATVSVSPNQVMWISLYSIFGVLIGVAIFLIGFFVVKFSYKKYQQRHDAAHPPFELA